MSDDNATPLTPQRALQSSRIIWFGFIAGQVIFLGIVVFLIKGGSLSGGSPEMIRILLYANLALLLTAAPAAHVLRSQIFKKHWQGSVVTPQGFLTGTIVFLALFEGVSLFSLVVVLLSGTFWPYIAPSAVALAVQAANFPTGRVMQADEPELLRR